jgi:hypothetical protein
LTGGLSRAIHIDDDPLFFCPIEQASGGSKWVPGEQILLKEYAQSFYGALVKGGKKTGQGRAMGQLVATKEGHERLGKRVEPFVKCLQGRLTAEYITNENNDKINEVVLAKVGTGETHPFLDRFQVSHMGENLAKAATSSNTS